MDRGAWRAIVQDIWTLSLRELDSLCLLVVYLMWGQSRGDVAEAGGHVAPSSLLSRTQKFIRLIKQKVQSSFIVSFLFFFS